MLRLLGPKLGQTHNSGRMFCLGANHTFTSGEQGKGLWRRCGEGQIWFDDVSEAGLGSSGGLVKGHGSRPGSHGVPEQRGSLVEGIKRHKASLPAVPLTLLLQ